MSTHQVATLDALPDGAGKCFEVEGKAIAVFKLEGGVHAIEDRCSHAEASLAQGPVYGNEVECPRHGAEFDLTTGQPSSLPATKPVAVYPTEIRDWAVFVTLPGLSDASEGKDV